jgi:hypothetical protein
MSPMKLTAIALMALLLPAAAHAQDDPKVGVTINAPTTIGVLWRVGDAFALRPEITLSRTTDESTGNDLLSVAPPITTDDNTAVGVALSALWYVGHKEALRTYVSPRFSYSRTTFSASTPTNTILGPSTSESTISVYSASGSFGAQYSLGRRFGVFGELGVAYSRTNTLQMSTFTTTSATIANGVLTQTIRQKTAQASARSNVVGTRAAVGVIVFF